MANSKSKQPLKTQEKTPWLYYISLPFRAITWPFYLIYWYLFRVPEVPKRKLGMIRLAIFVVIATQYRAIDLFILGVSEQYELPKLLSSLVLGLYSLLLLVGLFLSFFEILGLYDSTKSNYVFELDEPESINTGYSEIDSALEFRETILKTQHMPGKIEELKKTRFVSPEDISSASKSPELSKSLDFLNTRMMSQHALGKYNLLKEMFGGQ